MQDNRILAFSFQSPLRAQRVAFQVISELKQWTKNESTHVHNVHCFNIKFDAMV